MITREDTLTAWNDYQDALRRHADTAEDRADQEKYNRSRLATWDKIGMAFIMLTPVFGLVIVLSAVTENFMAALLLAAATFAGGLYHNSKEIKFKSALESLHNQNKLPAQKHRDFIATVADELRTQNYTVLDVNATADIPYIVTSAGVVTIAVVNNTPELRLGDQAIYSAYRDSTVEPVMHTCQT